MREHLLQALRWNHSFPNRTPLLAVAVGFIVGLAVPGTANAEPMFEWVRSGGSSNPDFGNSVAVDAEGNAYVVGYVQGPADFSGVRLTNDVQAGTFMFIAKYGPDGSLKWIKTPPLTIIPGQGLSSSANGVALDASGNVYVAGGFNGIITFGSTVLTNLTWTYGTSDIFLAKFDGDGNPVWARHAPGTDYGWGNAVAVSADGYVHVVGSFIGTVSFGEGTLTSAGSSQDAFHAEYDAAGNLVWAKKAGGLMRDYGYAVAADSSGNTYLAGEF
jgi:hypothetical protein